MQKPAVLGSRVACGILLLNQCQLYALTKCLMFFKILILPWLLWSGSECSGGSSNSFGWEWAECSGTSAYYTAEKKEHTPRVCSLPAHLSAWCSTLFSGQAFLELTAHSTPADLGAPLSNSEWAASPLSLEWACRQEDIKRQDWTYR
jgi:hypothetical protein